MRVRKLMFYSIYNTPQQVHICTVL